MSVTRSSTARGSARRTGRGRSRIYYRAGFFEAPSKGQSQGEPAFEMSSITLDNGVELYGTHEESDGGIEYRITRLESLPKPECFRERPGK